ncbi:hypothetical protein B2J88_38260 [Rhodococcus sp. SRB_17]|nr:hypothetical protein [Rhodococcus sp. SRB_17]
MSTANLARILDWNLPRFGSRDALLFEGRRWTYRDLHRDVNALAVALRLRGVKRGSRIAMLANTVPEFLITALALSKLGAVIVPLNYRLVGSELRYLVDHAGVQGIATVPDFVELATEAIAGQPDALQFALEPIGVDWQDVSELMAECAGQLIENEEMAADDLQRIIYTSGTTGRPKGVRLTHGNVMANMNTQLLELSLSHDDRVLNFAPLYHVGGLDIPGYSTWYAGACMIMLRRFDPAEVMETIEKEKVNGTIMAGTMMDMIRRIEGRTFDTGSMKWLIYNQVNRKMHDQARELFPSAVLTEAYGLTEVCGGLTFMDEEHVESKQGSVGRPLPWMDVRVVDTDDVPLASGEVGEVVARGPKVCDGYLDDSESTADTFRGGWFHTGDVGRIDEDGYLYILDRLKDMIRSGGENMASSEIEAVLCAFPGVLQASVIGAPDPKWIEVPTAFVVTAETISCDALIEHARQHLGKFKVPKEIYLVSELPTNPTGKILKRDLRDQMPSMQASWSAG